MTYKTLDRIARAWCIAWLQKDAAKMAHWESEYEKAKRQADKDFYAYAYAAKSERMHGLTS